MDAELLAPSRLRLVDLVTTSAVAFRTRRVRALLSALGVAIGIAALTSVVGITASERSALLAQIDRLGTNILTASDSSAGQGPGSGLPTTAAAMIARIPGVQRVSAIEAVPTLGVYRNDLVPRNQTAGLSVVTADPALPSTLGITLSHGSFLQAATVHYQVAVLGAIAAKTLGITTLRTATRVWVSGHWFAVVGIDNTVPLAPSLDRAVFIGAPGATALYGLADRPSTVYVRTQVSRTAAVAPLLARTADPLEPSAVAVNQPTAVLIARAAAVGTSTALLLGLAAITLAVAGIGVANVMVIAVLERRHEIGIRRALGASRAQVRRQFLVEAVTLSSAGAVAGSLIGVSLTASVAAFRGWPVVTPTRTLAAGIALSVVVGAIAGLGPALRAARQSPAQTLRT